MEDTEKKSFWKNMRRDSGELRFLISSLLILLSGGFLCIGYLLVKEGVLGQWAIVSSFRGWTFYLTSISLGLLVIILGAVIIIWGLREVIKNL